MIDYLCLSFHAKIIPVAFMKLSAFGTLADFIWFIGAAISSLMNKKFNIDIQNTKFKVEACIKSLGMVVELKSS